MVRIAPSILSADYGDLHAEIARVASYVDLLHVDVMDGHFVPNISIGPPVVKSIRKKTDLYFDCHLMISNPADYLEAFADAGANGCSVHYEVGNSAEHLRAIRELGMDAGLVVNPKTPFEAYEQLLASVDMIVLMTVEPGFGGQSFMHEVMPKLSATRAAIERRSLQVRIEVDGGVDEHTAPIAVDHGADTLVAGSAIFARPSPVEAAQGLREVAERIEQQRR